MQFAQKRRSHFVSFCVLTVCRRSYYDKGTTKQPTHKSTEVKTMTLENAMDRIKELEARINELEKINKDLSEKLDKPLTWNIPGYYITSGTRKNALEIYFDGMPGTGIIKQLKETLKMRWNPKKKCWYGFVSHNDIEYILQDPTSETKKETETFKTDDDGFIDTSDLQDPFDFVA